MVEDWTGVKMPNAETFPLLFAETIPPIAHPAHPVPEYLQNLATDSENKRRKC